MGKSPFTMPGSQFLGKGNQSPAPGKYTASPTKPDEKEKKEELNEWGETPEQYKKRMEEMGLRKPDEKEEEEK